MECLFMSQFRFLSRQRQRIPVTLIPRCIVYLGNHAVRVIAADGKMPVQRQRIEAPAKNTWLAQQAHFSLVPVKTKPCCLGDDAVTQPLLAMQIILLAKRYRAPAPAPPGVPRQQAVDVIEVDPQPPERVTKLVHRWPLAPVPDMAAVKCVLAVHRVSPKRAATLSADTTPSSWKPLCIQAPQNHTLRRPLTELASLSRNAMPSGVKTG